MKSLPVYFYVQKKFNLTKLNTRVPFEIERVNVGAAMNITTGTFTAPCTGHYFFSFNQSAVILTFIWF